MKYLGRAAGFAVERYAGASPNAKHDQVTLESLDTSASAAGTFALDRNKSPGANSDFLWLFQWLGRSSTSVSRIFSEIVTQIVTATNAAEDSKLIFRTMKAGTKTDVCYMQQGLVLGSPTGGDQGTGTVNATALRVNGVDVSTTNSVPVRQTVLSGPVDTNGLPSFGGSTGSTTVTMAGTLIATVANGFSSTGTVDRTGSIVNASWTGLSTNGTMYLYLEVASNGTCTTGSTTLAPTYQFGGTYSTTNNQYTFNIQDMVMKVGNGASASQTYRVFVGEVTVAGGVVTAITWYALMGRYFGPYTATLPTTATSISESHNLGCRPFGVTRVEIECTTTDAGYAVGDIHVTPGTQQGANNNVCPLDIRETTKTVAYTTGANTAWRAGNASTGALAALTAASWKYRFVVNRGW